GWREKGGRHSRSCPGVADGPRDRHWTSWSDGKRIHPFIVPLNGAPRDLAPGADFDAPPREREGSHPMAFSPDSQSICYIAITDPVEATSTNADLFEVSVNGGTPKRLTA